MLQVSREQGDLWLLDCRGQAVVPQTRASIVVQYRITHPTTTVFMSGSITMEEVSSLLLLSKWLYIHVGVTTGVTSRGITFTLNAENRFTLACISTGGPATNVTWTRDSTTVITEGTETVLNDPVTAQYIHPYSDCDWEITWTLHMYSG